MGDSDILSYQPGQTVTFYKEVKNANGQRTDDGYVPVVTRVVYPGFVTATGYPQSMSRLDVGLYFFQLVIPQGASAVGTYLVDIVYLDPNSLLLVNDSRQIIVTAPYGNYSASTIGSGGPSGLPGPPGPAGPPGPYGIAGGDLSGTYPNPKVISIQGHAVSPTTPTDGYVLTWSATDGYWKSASNFPITAPNIASLTSISAADGHAAFVQSVLAPWYFVINGSTLTIDHITVEATSLGGNTRWVRDTNYHHSLWAMNISHWYIDPVNGNDENQGGYSTTQALPASLKTFAEYIRRVGKNSSFSTVLGISSINIHWLNDQPNNSDPVDLYNSFHNVSLYMDGALIQAGSGTFGTVTNINRAGNIQTTAFNADGAAPLNYWTQFLGMLVHDTTNDTWFCVDRDLGNRQAQLTCPYVGAAPGIAFTMVPGTITAGHSYVIYRFPKVYAGIIAPPVYGEYMVSGTPTALAQFTHLHFASAGGASGLGATFRFASAAYSVIQECTFEGQAFIEGAIWEQTIVYNCFFLNGFNGREVFAFGGGANLQVNLSFDSTLDGDIIIHSGVEIQGNIAFGTVYFNDDRPGHQYLDIPLWGSFGSAPDGGTVVIMTATFGGPGAIWGPTTLRIKSNGRLYLTGTAAQNILFTGSILIDGITTGAKVTPGSPRRLTDGIPITPANIDSTVGGWSSGIASSFSDSCGIFSYIPSAGTSALTQTDWYVDWVAGNDANDGKTAGTAVKTYMGGIVSKWGTVSPLLTQTVTIHVLSTQPLGGEHIVIAPILAGAHVNFLIVGTETLVASSTLSAVTAKNRSTNTDFQITGIPVGTALGNVLKNTTTGKASVAFVRTLPGGGVAKLSQPLVALNSSTPAANNPAPAEIDTWALSDTVSAYSLPLFNIEAINVIGTGQSPTFPETGGIVWLQGLHIPDQSGVAANGNLPLAFEGGNIVATECWFQNFVVAHTGFSNFVNVNLGGGAHVSNSYICGGLISSSGIGLLLEISNRLDGDFINDDFINIFGVCNFGLVQNNGTGIAVRGASSLEIDLGLYGNGILWGSTGKLEGKAVAAIVNSTSHTWVNTLTMAGSLLLDGATTATKYVTGVFTDGVTISAANLDSFGGLQNVKSGSRFTF